MLIQLQETHKKQNTEKSSQRVQIVDVFRGFALFGILLIHSLQNFLNTNTTRFQELTAFDSIIKFAVLFFIEDKFFIIFSFLFGWSFFVMYQSAVRKSQPFVKKFIWRLAVLLAIGIFHSLFFRADILQVYAIVGLILVLCRNFRSRSLLLLSVSLFLCSIPCLIFTEQLSQLINTLKESGINLPSKVAYNVISGRIFTTSSIFLLGFYAGKMNFLSDLSVRNKHFQKVFLGSSYVFLLTILCLALSTDDSNSSEHESVIVFRVVCSALQNISLSCLYISIIALLYDRALWSKYLSYLIPLGKMGLTGYLMQSVFFQLFYQLKGGIKTSLFAAMIITIIFYAGQIVFARYWLSRFKCGPVEWLWRSLTNLADLKK